MNTSRVTQRGGAQVGWLSASWPFASIQIAHGSLTVSALGKYAFAPGEVHAIEPIGSIPVLTTGIRIHHTRPDFPEKIVFYSMGGRDRLLDAASAAGFTVGQPTLAATRGFPVRISAIVVFVLMWNGLLILDVGANPFNAAGRPGLYSLLALALAFTVATFIPRSPRLQELFLRDGHDVGEIRSFLRLMQVVTGLLALTTGLTMWFRW
jgi:hypothetical protein